MAQPPVPPSIASACFRAAITPVSQPPVLSRHTLDFAWAFAWVFALLFGSLLTAPARAELPERAQGTDAATTDLDRNTWIRANSIEMVTTNHGSFGYDIPTGNPGLIYPSGGQNTALFAGGLWIGALTPGNQLRVTVAEYSFEYAPGRIEEDGSWDPNYSSNPRWRTYAIARGDTPGSNPDYDEWPTEDGAPVDDDGNPLHLGEQTLFSVWHDLDEDRHTNDAGSTAPLGVEVQQTTFALDDPGAANEIVFVQWMIRNEGDVDWHDVYLSTWSDPDLGGANDDLVGCVPEASLGYCYNATNNDNQYGAAPPAIAIQLVQGPIVPSPGDVAWVSGIEIPGYRNLPMTAFIRCINGTDPTAPSQSYNCMRGFERDGSLLVDPTTGEITTFAFSGNPLDGTGWIDSNPSDRRMMVTSGPFDLAVGESQTVAIAIVLGQGANRLESVARLWENAAEAEAIFRAAWGVGPGACCLDEGPCIITTQTDCLGNYFPDAPCDPSTCARIPGACCFDSGACLLLFAEDCNGEFQGAGTECTPGLCPEWGPESLCCLGGGSCDVLTERDCLALGGVYVEDQVCWLLPPGDPPGWQLTPSGDPMFDQITDGGTPVPPDDSGGPGRNVWHGYDASGQWLLSAGGGDGGFGRITRDGVDEENLEGADVEIRWNDDPSNYGWWYFDDSITAAPIPFGLWLVDPIAGTEERLLPLFYSGGGTVGIYDIDGATPDGHFRLPGGDWIYGYTGNYDDFLADARDGEIEGEHGEDELFARLSVVAPGRQLPDPGTVIRLVTRDGGVLAGSDFAGQVPLDWELPDGLAHCFGTPAFDVHRDGNFIGTTARTDFLDGNAEPGTVHRYTVLTRNPITEERSDPSAPSSARASVTGYALASGWTEVPPTLDGFIQPGEWAGASIVDASLGSGSPPAQMRFLNDAKNLYIAIEGPKYGFTRICLDPDASGTYDRGDFEGELRFFFEGASFTRAVGAYPATRFEIQQFAPWAEVSTGGEDGVEEIRVSLTDGPLRGVGVGDRFGVHVARLRDVAYPRGARTVLREAPWLFAALTLADPGAPGGGEPAGNVVDEPTAAGDDSGDPSSVDASGTTPSAVALLGRADIMTRAVPNPFSASTTLAFRVPVTQPVTIQVYTIDGRLVRTLHHEAAALAGAHTVVWDGTDSDGRSLPPGVYSYEVRGTAFRWSGQMTLLR